MVFRTNQIQAHIISGPTMIDDQSVILVSEMIYKIDGLHLTMVIRGHEWSFLVNRGFIAGQMINYPFTNHHRRIHFQCGIFPGLHLEPCG